MTKTCKNCGHDERHHKKNRFYPEVKEGECLALRGFKEACTCKKFEAEDETYNEVTHNFLEQELNKEFEKPQKGCSKKNHSPQEKNPGSAGRDSAEFKDKGSDVSVGLNPMSSGSFNLSNKECSILINKIDLNDKKRIFNLPIGKLVFQKGFFKDDIKEFIRRLKEEIDEIILAIKKEKMTLRRQDSGTNLYRRNVTIREIKEIKTRIDKLAGKELK